MSNDYREKEVGQSGLKIASFKMYNYTTFIKFSVRYGLKRACVRSHRLQYCSSNNQSAAWQLVETSRRRSLLRLLIRALMATDGKRWQFEYLQWRSPSHARGHRATEHLNEGNRI